MATLTLTNEEKAANSFLSFDDASLGRLVKNGAIEIADDADEKDETRWMTCAMMLVGMAHKKNTDRMTVDLKGMTYEGQGIGDWKLTLKRTKARTSKGTQ